MIDPILHKELRDKYSPDGSALRTVQLNLLDILIEFDRICRKHNISYWLEYGTLLGAERHGGFIPWDDDLDVCILKKDRKRLKQAIKQELDEPFYFLDSESGYQRRWVRIANKTITVSRKVTNPKNREETITKNENIWLDVFFDINGAPSLSKKLDAFFGRCYRRRFRQIDDGWLKHLLGLLLYPIAQLSVLAARIWGSLFMRKHLVDDYGTGIYYIQKDVKDIFPLTETEFEGHKFFAPNSSDHYLKNIYGNWTELPKTITNHSIDVVNIGNR